MHFNLNDTIAAPATPSGTSALAVLRVSGPDSFRIVSSLWSDPDKILQADGYRAVHGYLIDKEDVVDEAVCLVYRAPHSYTGDDMVEISSHGNPDLANRILQLFLRDCRLAEAGEFTFRAFMNHKLDLAQAEAVNDLIQAHTSRAETAALSQLRGNLSQEIAGLVDAITANRIQFELAIDFADQDLPAPDLDAVKADLESIRNRLQLAYEGGKQGRILRDGFTVCLTGAPNVGKSSLFNKFLQENRAIVTDVPGTTRDYLAEWLSLDGFPVRLIDTAGLRESNDTVEQIGIGRTRELMSSADLVVMLTDPDTLDTECCSPEHTIAGKTLCVLNKVDLLGLEQLPAEQDWHAYLRGSRFETLAEVSLPLLPCSAVLPDGISALRQEIIQRMTQGNLQPSQVLVTNSRHLAAIARALGALHKALEAIAASAGYEFIAFDLIEAASALSEITGAVTTDAMLESIFSSFCIGK